MYSKISSRDPTQTPRHAGVRSRGERWANQHYRMINCRVESPRTTGADDGSVGAIIVVNALGSVDVAPDAGYRLGFSREKLSLFLHLSLSLATLCATTERNAQRCETAQMQKLDAKIRERLLSGYFRLIFVSDLQSFGNLVLCSIQQCSIIILFI